MGSTTQVRKIGPLLKVNLKLVLTLCTLDNVDLVGFISISKQLYGIASI